MRDIKTYNEYQREYQRQISREKYRKFRIWAINYLSGACDVCGETNNLEIDHIDASQKRYETSNLHTRRKEIQVEELNKCHLLCQLHHKEKTRQNKEAPQTFSINENIHGSGYMKIVRKCNCVRCKAWSTLYKVKQVEYKTVLTDAQVLSTKLSSYTPRNIITRKGYLKEKRSGLEHCDECKRANAEYHKQLRLRKL